MLGKLVKHELKATTRIFLPIYAILLVISIVNRFTFQLKIYQGVLPFLSAFFIFLYVTSIVLVLAATLILMITRFYKNLLTDEGYLMFTLPAKTYQLINSKLLIHLLWSLVSFLAVMGSAFLVFGTPDSIHLIKEAFQVFYQEFQLIAGGNEVILILQFILATLLSQICNILSVYASIALGQLFHGHKIIGSFAAYIGLYTALQVILLIIMGGFALFNMDQMETLTVSYLNFAFLLTILFLCVTNVVFYALTNHIFKKKLNLD